MLLVFKRLSDYKENYFNLILFWRQKITVGLYCQTSWVNNEDKPFKTDIKYTTAYYRNDVNSNPTTTAQCYQADVFSPPQLLHLSMCLYIYALKNNFLMRFFNRNYSSTFAGCFGPGRMMTTKVREIYMTFGFGSHKTTFQWKIISVLQGA